MRTRTRIHRGGGGARIHHGTALDVTTATSTTGTVIARMTGTIDSMIILQNIIVIAVIHRNRGRHVVGGDGIHHNSSDR